MSSEIPEITGGVTVNSIWAERCRPDAVERALKLESDTHPLVTFYVADSFVPFYRLEGLGVKGGIGELGFVFHREGGEVDNFYVLRLAFEYKTIVNQNVSLPLQVDEMRRKIMNKFQLGAYINDVFRFEWSDLTLLGNYIGEPDAEGNRLASIHCFLEINWNRLKALKDVAKFFPLLENS